MLELLISNKYRLTNKLGNGAFYDVFKALHIKNQTSIAIKLQKRSVSESKLFNEVKIIKEICGQDMTADLGFPSVYESGSDGVYNYIVMDLLGISLDRMMADGGGKLQVKFALQIGLQMIERIELIHSKGFIHRDLRPEHLLYGRQKRPNKLYLTGLAMSKKYKRIDNKHIDYKDNKLSFTGTARYLSMNGHLGIQQTRRDDIQAFVHVLVYLMKGYLPWQKLQAKGRRDKYEKILDKKLVTSVDQVCQGTPLITKQLLLYAKMLQFQDTPDYQYIKKCLRDALVENDNNLIFSG